MITATHIGLYRQTLDRYRVLRLGPQQAAELLALAEKALEARTAPQPPRNGLLVALELVAKLDR